jgi:type II secretion system protein J
MIFNRPTRCETRAFTLIEVLLALAVSAIVLAAISGVFYSALRLRERTSALLDESVPVQRALGLLRRDLQGVLPPGGVLAGDFKNGALTSGTAQGFGLQFYTTTGVINDDAPWGDIQEVTYQLRDPADRNRALGKDLIRAVTRNLLATTVLNSDEQWLLGNIQNLEFACFDGSDWRDSWDTSAGNTNLPTAVRVRIQLAADNDADTRNRQPLELIVPLISQSRTNQTSTTGGSGG